MQNITENYKRLMMLMKLILVKVLHIEITRLSSESLYLSIHQVNWSLNPLSVTRLLKGKQFIKVQMLRYLSLVFTETKNAEKILYCLIHIDLMIQIFQKKLRIATYHLLLQQGNALERRAL